MFALPLSINRISGEVMELAPEVMAQCTTLGHCFAAAGLYVSGQPPVPMALMSLLVLMGQAPADTPSQFLAIAIESDYNKLMDECKVVEKGPGGADVRRSADFIEVAKARAARHYARLHHKLEASSAHPVTDPSADPVHKLAEQVKALAEASIKPPDIPKAFLKETINQTAEGTARRLSADEVVEAYRQCERQFG